MEGLWLVLYLFLMPVLFVVAADARRDGQQQLIDLELARRTYVMMTAADYLRPSEWPTRVRVTVGFCNFFFLFLLLSSSLLDRLYIT